MRRLRLAVAVLVLGVSAACSGSGTQAKVRDEVAPTTVVSTALVSLDRVGVKPYCSQEDGFCADFPYLDNPSARNSGTGLPNFSTSSFAAKDDFPAFRSYQSQLAWGYDGAALVFCGDRIDPHCYDTRLSYKTGVPFDWYSVVVWQDDQPTASLDSWDRDCLGWENRVTSEMTVAGRPALHVTCTYRNNPEGRHDLIFFRGRGRVYELIAVDQVHEPFFTQKFFDSFRFTT